MQSSQRLSLGILAVVFFAIVGCREHHRTFRVELPQGFSGPVAVNCGLYDGDFQTIIVDSAGKASGAMCSKEEVNLVVVRDGKVVMPQMVSWDRTGDGIPTKLSFEVR